MAEEEEEDVEMEEAEEDVEIQHFAVSVTPVSTVGPMEDADTQVPHALTKLQDIRMLQHSRIKWEVPLRTATAPDEGGLKLKM